MPRAKHKTAGDQRRRKATPPKARSPMAQAEVVTAEADSQEAVFAETAITEKAEAFTFGTESSALMLPDCLDSSAAADIKGMLIANRGNAIVVDASQVRRVGVQSLQVLVAAARTWQGDGQSFRLENPSSEFLETIALIGLPREDLMLEGTHQ
jgi:anti-anti-sigma regulatory factor